MRLRIIWRTSPLNGAGRFCWERWPVSNKKANGRADTAVWLAGDKDETEPPRRGMMSSVAHETIVTLRKIGLHDYIIATKEGLVVYPGQLDKENCQRVEKAPQFHSRASNFPDGDRMIFAGFGS